jgi:hypothetical protein
MTVRSGRKCSELLTKQDPVGSLVKTLLESSRWNSTISFLHWKQSVTPAGRLLFRLAPSMPDTEGTEFGLWPTPTVQDSDKATKKMRSEHQNNLTAVVFNSPMFPTPTARDHKGSYTPEAMTRKDGKSRMDGLPQAAAYHADGNPNHSGSLNPAWVEWLMGYPIGHTVCADWETPSSRKSRKKSSEQSPQ